MVEYRWPLNVPVLTDGTVTLRAHVPADLPDLFEMTRDPDMRRWTSVPDDNAPADSEHFVMVENARTWDDGSAMAWAIEVADDSGRPRFAGNVDIRDRGVSTIGFALHPWARRRGVMTAAVRLAVDHAFGSGFTEAVHWRSHVGNLASLRTAHACGFRLVAEVPALLFEKGRAIDGWHGVLLFGDAPYPRGRWRGGTRLAVTTAGGRRLGLREARLTDVPRLVQTFADTVTQHWLAGTPATTPDVTTAVHRWWWRAATGQQATWVVVDADSDVVLGQVAIMDLLGIDPTAGELGYSLHPDARGHGVLAAALPVLVQHALAAEPGLDLRRLTAAAAEGNHASLELLRRTGFTPTGRQSAAEPLGDGSHADLHEFELLAPPGGR